MIQLLSYIQLRWLVEGDQKQIQQMRSRCNSAPKMDTVYTARVKDGRYSNESPQKHYYGRTAPRFGHSNHNYFNPENSPEKPKQAQKIGQNEVQELVERKISIQPQQPEVKRQGKISVENPKKTARPGKQQTINGRKLEFPAERIHNPQRQESVQVMRSSSLSSKHFVDRATKSTLIKSKKEELDDKFKVAFGYLLENNEAYLAERRRACNQKARPKEEIFKMQRPYSNTHNNDEYGKKSAVYDQYIEPQNLKTANSFGPRKVCGSSTTNEFHNGVQGPRADLAQWPEGFKLQGPIYGVTTHANNFPHPGDYQKMVPVTKFNEHPMGFPHKTNSTHRTFHKGEFVKATDLATWNNLHPYGNNFDPNRGTTYSQHHNDKEQPPIQQWPMYEPEFIKSDGKFSTEHRSNLINHTQHQLNQPNYCDCGRKSGKH